jgi:hypothetical protein
MMVMIATALVAAVLYGAGAAVEQRQAAAAPQSSAGRPGLLLMLVRQPLWLLGMLAQIGGFAAHAVALRTGPLATVQMLVAAELVVAVVFVRVWSGRPLRPASWVAALTVVAGSSVFLAVTSSDHRQAVSHPNYVMAAALGTAVLGGAALAAAVAGLRATGRGRAVLLAVAAGLADACSAVVTLGFSHVASHGVVALFTSWTIPGGERGHRHRTARRDSPRGRGGRDRGGLRRAGYQRCARLPRPLRAPPRPPRPGVGRCRWTCGAPSTCRGRCA